MLLVQNAMLPGVETYSAYARWSPWTGRRTPGVRRKEMYKAICAGDYTIKRAIIANNAYENQIFL